jgi:hypothetical protein
VGYIGWRNWHLKEESFLGGNKLANNNFVGSEEEKGSD